MEAIPGYLSLHQTADVMTLKWTPNQLMNGSMGDLEYERRCDQYAAKMTSPLQSSHPHLSFSPQGASQALFFRARKNHCRLGQLNDFHTQASYEKEHFMAVHELP